MARTHAGAWIASAIGRCGTFTAAAVAGVALCGCATIFTGTSDEVTFEANVPNVRLSIDGRAEGQLPIKLDVSRNFFGDHHFRAKFEAPGYETQEFKLDRAFNGVAILDITSPVTSGGIDLLTGSIMLISPREYHVQMVPSGQGGTAEYDRGREAYRFGLTNYAAIQRDVARGGGLYLSAFAQILGRNDAEATARIVGASLLHREYLVGGEDPRTFVRRYCDLIAADPELRAYGL
jgi:hypothetical protein